MYSCLLVLILHIYGDADSGFLFNAHNVQYCLVKYRGTCTLLYDQSEVMRKLRFRPSTIVNLTQHV